jgi:hypothetical protein
MAHIRIEQNKNEFEPRVVIAETGERISGVASVIFQSVYSKGASEVTITLAAGTFEMDVALFDRSPSRVKKDGE